MFVTKLAYAVLSRKVIDVAKYNKNLLKGYITGMSFMGGYILKYTPARPKVRVQLSMVVNF